MSTDICRWLFLLFFLTTSWVKYSNSKEIRVVCYYTNWSVYRPGTAKFSPQNINPYLCTHLIYAFGGFTKENTLKPFDKYQDIEKGGYAKFTGLKTYNKNLKTMLAIGGWNEGSSRFSPMVANSERRKELIKNAIKFLRQNHFDGLDLDWEYPSFRDGGKSRDRDNYAQLVQELREEFERESDKTGRPRLLLTMAVPAGIEYINKGYDVPKLTKYLDWMNILSYDYHSAFEPAVNHHAPLYPLEEPSEYNYDTELNIDYTIEHYLKKGADPNKLVLGIPTYGRSYTLFNPDANEMGAPADGPGEMGDATRENGYLAYYEICEYIKSQDWEVVQPNSDAMGPYAFKDNQWVGYDDDQIARKKAEYVAEKNLGGIMFWSIDNDDFRGTCHGKPYPIIEAAKEALIRAYGLTDDNLISPPSKPGKSKTRTRTQTKSSNDKKEVTSSNSRRRNRVKPKEESTSSSNNRAKIRRKEPRRTTEGTVYSSLELVTPSYTTPAPPPTPGMGGEFKCEDEGFYPHPKDCKKYFWCLSGPGELGIVAHQFTCPAGLYFNKAADSCDYTRNVLCNKKLSKGTTTTTEATTSKTTPVTSTARVPPKITAATSKTTVFRTSTTTEAYEDDYEYEDEEDGKNSEEDPRVIKELFDLIRKAGGIEELEKQLKIHEDGSLSVSSSDATTPSSISKSLVERVLGKAAKKEAVRKNSYSFLNRNSRGPQNQGIKPTEEKEKHDRGRLQYTTITRQRSQKSDENDEEEDEDEDIENEDKTSSRQYTKKQPEYVNIRRGRVSSTTEEPDEESKGQINRNKVLGEEYDEDDEDEEQTTKKKASTPHYVNIRRQRPSTTEETSTSKYTVIRRGTTEADEDDANKKREPTTQSPDDSTSKRRGTTDIISSSTEKVDSKSKYKILRRGSTTEASISSTSIDDEGSTLPSKKRGTTLPSVQDISVKTKSRGSSTLTPLIEEKYKTVKRGSTTESSTQTEETLNDDSTLKYSLVPQISTTEDPLDATTVISETENPIIVEHILITSPESLTIKTTASISSTNRPSDLSKVDSKLTESPDGVVQTTPQLFEPRPFSISSIGPSSTLKPVTEPSTRVTKVSDPNYKLRLRQNLPKTQTDVISTTTLTTEKPAPFRTRAPSRFKQTTPSLLDQQTSKRTLKPSVRARKRFSTTTENSSQHYEEYDIGRTFRPSDLADLSSLTAVDFTGLRDINRFNNPRHRRPRPSTTTTEKAEDSLKSGSRTLPLTRKVVNGTTFGKSRRVFTNKQVEDQVNSGSDTTHRIRPFSRAPQNLTITSTTEASSRATLRNRKIIRRLRPTVSSKQDSQTDDSHNQIVFKKRLVRPSSTAATETENLIENASSNSLYNRRFTRPSTATAEEINKLTTTTESLLKLNKRLNETDEQNETSEDVSAEEGENIRLSESNIRENSNVNNHNVLKADDKIFRRKVLKRIRNKVDDEKAATEPNVIIRTRKIIRKLQPTESTVSTSDTTTEPIEITTQGRKRKIIRRLRPTTAQSSLNNTEAETEKTLFIRGRPFTPSLNTKSESTKDDDEAFKSRYKTIARSTTPKTGEETVDDEESEEHSVLNVKKTFTRTTKAPVDNSSERAIDRSKYSTLNRGTTENYDSDLEEVEEDKETSTLSKPKYRIYRPTIFHDEDDEEEENEKDEEKSPRILNPVLSSTVKKETDENDEENSKHRIRNPVVSSTVQDKEDEIKILLKPLNEEVLETSQESSKYSSTTELSEDKFNVTNNNEEVLESTEEPDSEETTEDFDGEQNATTTTLRNYVNPILSRQRNRPAFVRPKLTTQNPLRTTESDRPRYKGGKSRSTVRPIKLLTEESEEFDDKKFERKFVPRGFSRTRQQTVGQENRTTTSDIVNVNVSTTEFYNTSDFEAANSTEYAEITTLLIESELKSNDELNTTTPEEIVTSPVNEYVTLNDALNTTVSYNTSDETLAPEVTTITLEFTTQNIIENSTESSTNLTETSSISTLNTTTESNSYSSTDSENYQPNESTITYEISTDHVPATEESLTSYQPKNNAESESDTSTFSTDTSTTETTPVYQLKSTLRSFQNRPRYNVPKRLTSTESSSTTRPSNRFNQRNRGQTTKSRLITPSVRSTTPITPLKNRFIYKYSTTERSRLTTKENEEDEEVEEENDEEIYTSSSHAPRGFNSKTKPRLSNKPEGFSFRKTTPTPKTNEELSDIDEEAVKNRNKNLFSKKRKMNTPFSGQPQNHTDVESTTQTSVLTTTPQILDSATKPTEVFETTTESLTTLHHIFAETELVSGKESTTTETTVPDNVTKSSSSKVERLIEVNRIVEVHDMNSTVNDSKVIDKIGVINRITVVKVVDGNPKSEDNEIVESTSELTTISSNVQLNNDNFEIATVREIPNEVQPKLNDRQERKFEIYGNSKVLDYNGKTATAEIIDGRSQINIITPRPLYSTEASTIALEGLFQTDTPQKLSSVNVNLLKPSSDDELLETGNSRFINVRVLGDKEIDESQIVSVRVPKEDYITMKAEVVEVTPKTNKDVIKIVPIKVEMSRKLLHPSDFNMKIEHGVPKVNFQILKSNN